MKAHKVNELQNFTQPGEGISYAKLGIGKISEVKKILDRWVKSYRGAYQYDLKSLDNITIGYSQRTIDSIKDEKDRFKKIIEYKNVPKFYIKKTTSGDGSWGNPTFHYWYVYERQNNFNVPTITPDYDVWNPKNKINVLYGEGRYSLTEKEAEIEATIIAEAFSNHFGSTVEGFIIKE